MYLALREMRFAKARYSLIATIMVLIAFLVLFITGLAQGLAYDNASSVQNMAATHFVLEQGSNHRFTRSQVDHAKLEAAERIVGKNNAELLGLRMTTVVPFGGTKKVDVTILAVEPDGWLSPAVITGSSLSADAAGQVMVDQKLSEEGVSIGTILVDQPSGTKFTVSGFVRNESFSHAPVVFVNQRDWLAIQSQADQPVYNAIAIKGATAQGSELQAALPGMEVIKKSAAVSAIPGYKEEQGTLTMMIVFLFIISAFVLAVFFYVITIQKTSQFGILKAIGARTAYLARSVTLQVLVLSVGSLVLSGILVRLFEIALPESMPFRLGSSTFVWTSAVFIAMSVSGSLFSVWKVARIDALDAIGRAAA
ncbi:ABC transporter permease [Paenibacillus kobensis]|uniref:ABC transporter permease n=1 Tax=Paenibacillus kobensis TaxID=59841 RepID=UPI000FDAD13F|nr:ABC transporter permease [Paenibacillus kobensis]